MGNPILVIAPLSTLGFWKSEIESWTTLDVCLYHDILGGKYIHDSRQGGGIETYERRYKTMNGTTSTVVVDTLVRTSPISTSLMSSSQPMRLPSRIMKIFRQYIPPKRLGMIFRFPSPYWWWMKLNDWRASRANFKMHWRRWNGASASFWPVWPFGEGRKRLGTPLQNNMTELWTLLQFVAPRVMPPLPTFLEQYGNLENEEQVWNEWMIGIL